MSSLLVEEIRFSVPARLDACAIIRERVNEMAASLPFSADDLTDIKLAVGEAASNAVKHGCRGLPEAEVGVSCWTDGSELGVRISDDGPGFDPDSVRPPDLSEFPEGGMGIFYMYRSMDQVSFSFVRGTTVTLTKKFAR